MLTTTLLRAASRRSHQADEGHGLISSPQRHSSKKKSNTYKNHLQSTTCSWYKRHAHGRRHSSRATAVSSRRKPRPSPPTPAPAATTRSSDPGARPLSYILITRRHRIQPLNQPPLPQYCYTPLLIPPPDAGALPIRVSERSRRAFPSTIGRKDRPLCRGCRALCDDYISSASILSVSTAKVPCLL